MATAGQRRETTVGPSTVIGLRGATAAQLQHTTKHPDSVYFYIPAAKATKKEKYHHGSISTSSASAFTLGSDRVRGIRRIDPLRYPFQHGHWLTHAYRLFQL